MTELELALGTVALVLIVVVSSLAYLVIHFQRKSRLYFNNWQTRQTDAYVMGTHQKIGDISQVLGTFASLGDYEQVILLSTTSAQSSIDLLGIKTDCLEFVEFKKKGGDLGKAERKIRRLVEQGKVKYVIKDVELPDTVRVTERASTIEARREKTIKENGGTLVEPLSRVGGKDVKIEGEALKIELEIRAKMREISGLTNQQIEALPEGEIGDLYEKAASALESENP